MSDVKVNRKVKETSLNPDIVLAYSWGSFSGGTGTYIIQVRELYFTKFEFEMREWCVHQRRMKADGAAFTR